MTFANDPNDTTALAELKIDIPEEPALWWSECCIYEVPKNLRRVNKEAYTPQFVSIGPIHHNDENLKPMEKQKRIYLKCFHRRLLNRTQNLADNYLIAKFKPVFEREAKNIQKCYSKKYDGHIFNKSQFADMILLDAVFIMELFLRNINKSEQENDLLFTNKLMKAGLMRDLLLLENQIPMYILRAIYCDIFPPPLPDQGHCSFHDLAIKYISNKPGATVPNAYHKIFYKSKHLTDFIRYICLPTDFFRYCLPTVVWKLKSLSRSNSDKVDDLTTAKQLDEAGITFETDKDNVLLLAIKFEKKEFLNKYPFLSLIPWTNRVKSRLIIPQLAVDDAREAYFRNIIALEQCHYPKENYFCNYVALLDFLIDTKEDADFLIDKQIIVQKVGSNKEVATLFNKLLKEVYVGPSCYGDIIVKLNKHYDNPWNLAMAKLKSVYFRDLWRGSLTVVGLFIFFFTLFNTIHTFLETILRSGFKFVIPMSLKGSIAF